MFQKRMLNVSKENDYCLKKKWLMFQKRMFNISKKNV